MATSVSLPTIQHHGHFTDIYKTDRKPRDNERIRLPNIVSMESVTKSNTLPIRKESFVPLRLGPVSRSRTYMDANDIYRNGHMHNGGNGYHVRHHHDQTDKNVSTSKDTGNDKVKVPRRTTGSSTKYPRIIVRDSQGRKLDTFTTLQEAIYRANWTRKKQGDWPRTPLEWRLPKAPVPSKPDFSRAGPRSMTSLAYDSSQRPLIGGQPSVNEVQYMSASGARKAMTQIDLTADVLVNIPTLEIPVDDVSFIAQSLQYLPNLPSFSFLRHSLLAGQSTYVQIVASILLHQKQLQTTEIRQNDWEFPGFCSGCKRSGFCYGCTKNSRPHVHEDLPAWTGGGFRFWKPDRPRDPHSWKNPNNWKLPSSELELQKIIQKYGGLSAYENAVIAARREMATSVYENELSELMSQGATSEGRRLERITTLGSYPPQVTIVSTDKMDEGFGGDDASTIESLLKEEMEKRNREGGGGGSGAGERGKTGNGKGGEDTASMREIILRRLDEKRRERSRSRSYDSSLRSRRRRIGVTSYKEDSSVTSRSQSLHNPPSITSEDTTVRIDTGFGDELDEEDITEDGEIDEGDEEKKKVRISVNDSPLLEVPDSRGRKTTRISTSGRSQSQSLSTGVPDRKTSQASSSVSRKTSRLSYKDETKEKEEQEEARKRKEQSGEEIEDEAMQSIPFAKKRREVLYKAPKFFVVQKKTRKIINTKDPFSTDRELNVPKGPAFQLKKGEKKKTKFVEFKRGDRTWKAPKAFEVKHTDTKQTGFWKPPVKKETDDDKKKRKGRSGGGLQRTKTSTSIDSGLQSNDKDSDDDDGGPKDGLLNGQQDDQASGAGGNEDNNDLNKNNENDDEKESKPKRREIVKKSRVEKDKPATPPQSPGRLPSPPAFHGRREHTPTPSPPRTPTPPPLPQVPLPDIELPSIPDLPTIGDTKPQARKQKMKFAVEAPPPLQEAKKKRRPPPKVRIIPKGMYKARKTRPAEAPVTQDEIMDIRDPLDFLAKYCIINPDRLPFYEIIFETTVADQEPLYSKDEEKEKKKDDNNKENEKTQNEADKSENEEVKTKEKSKKKKKKKTKDEKDEKGPSAQIKPELLPANRGMDINKVAMTIEEQHLEKLIYTLDLLHGKMDKYSKQLASLEDQRIVLLAALARDKYPEVTVPDYFPKVKKKGKKAKKSKTHEIPLVKLRHDQITDDVIVARLDDKMLSELYSDKEVHGVEIEMGRLKQKIGDVQIKVEKIASEKLLADAFCMNHFFLRQGLDKKIENKAEDTTEGEEKPINPEAIFRRQQSELYNRLHPNPDYEMNMDEVEGALQQINNHLLTEKEFAFLYNVLNLPRRTKVNFRLFSIIAALSEKVTQLDPVIKKLMNNFNYNALDVKMEKCKELFELLEADNMPSGGAQVSSLAVELTAGGLRPQNIRHVLHKFNRENRGVVDFLDFVTYVPLFVEIHKRIISDPLRQHPDL